MQQHPANVNEQLLNNLQEQQVLGNKDVDRAISLAKSANIRLSVALMQLGLVEEEVLLRQYAQVQEQMFFDTPLGLEMDPKPLAKLSSEYCIANVIVPIQQENGSSLLLTNAPDNAELKEEVAFYLEKNLVFAVATTRVIKSVLENLQAPKEANGHVPTEEQRRIDQELLRASSSDGPVIRFVAEKFNEAVALGASDIHFESQEDGLRIRFRNDGVLSCQTVDSALNAKSILARVKVMASLNVSERRLPQDGRITTTISGRKIDFRVSSVPTSFGESIVCRVLDPKALRLGWEKLGFDAETIKKIIRVIEQPSGLFLVTGPTGSGKTTTLYTALTHLNDEASKILTVEDPVEYNLSGIDQVQVHEEIGMTFAKALRSFLRQDPNVIMIGEIRDQETAEIACRAALVGRLVISTLHTNTPEGALNRLVDLGVPEYIVKDVLIGILGQKLVITDSGRKLEARIVTNF